MTPGTFYRFVVKAKNDAGLGEASDVLTIQAAVVPAAPEPPSLILQNEQTIELEWDDPIDDGASDVTGFVLYWDEGSSLNINSFEELFRADAFTKTFVKTTGLSAGDPYNFKVSAFNAIGESSQSEPAFEVYAARTPDPPTDVVTVSTSSSHITFTWVIPYDGGSPITYYQIFWDEGSGLSSSTFIELAYTSDPDNEFTLDHSMTAGDPYQFVVKAVNIIGPGTGSDTVSFFAASLPSTPEAPYKVIASTTSI